MKTTAITLAALLAATLAAHAQIDVNNIKSITVNKTGTNAEVTAMREIGRSTLECVYKALSPERGNEEQPIRMKEDRMILQTGGGVSKFYSYYRFAMDSLQKADPTNVMNTAQRKDGTTACLYMGYPETGLLTLTEGIGSTYYLYEDEVPEIGWTIGDEKREILGYACRRADCTLYGRRFTAWFTEEIPVMSGPWKLHGLPGLIMAAADDEGTSSGRSNTPTANISKPHAKSICDSCTASRTTPWGIWYRRARWSSRRATAASPPPKTACRSFR